MPPEQGPQWNHVPHEPRVRDDTGCRALGADGAVNSQLEEVYQWITISKRTTMSHSIDIT